MPAKLAETMILTMPPEAAGQLRETLLAGAATAPLTASEQMPTPAAAEKNRAVLMGLDDYFDIGRSAYKAGWSDEKLAKECGVAVENVRQLRMMAYGEIKEDPAVTEMKTLRKEIEVVLGHLRSTLFDLGAIAGAAARMKASVGEIEATASTARAQNRLGADACERILARIDEDLKRLGASA